MKQAMKYAVLLMLLMASSGLAEVRTWVGKNGVSLNAEFSSLECGEDGVILVLRKQDGSLIRTKPHNLCSADQAWVKAILAASRAAHADQNNRNQERHRIVQDENEVIRHGANKRKRERHQLVQDNNMERDMMRSRAFQLESRIRNSQHNPHAHFSGMANEASFLSQDASRLGESSAAFHFGNAALKLEQMNRNQNRNRQNDSFGSQHDSNRRVAADGVWAGGSSIDSMGFK